MADIVEQRNCPNCGAPVTGGKYCSYCGTKFEFTPFMEPMFRTIEIVPDHVEMKKFHMTAAIDGGLMAREDKDNVFLMARAIKMIAPELARHILEEKAFELWVHQDLLQDQILFDILVSIGITERCVAKAGFKVR